MIAGAGADVRLARLWRNSGATLGSVESWGPWEPRVVLLLSIDWFLTVGLTVVLIFI